MNTEITEEKILFGSVSKFILLNLAIALVITLLHNSSTLFSANWITAVPTFLLSFLMSTFLSIGGFYVDHYYQQRFSWIEFPVKRLFLTTTTYLLYSIVVSFSLMSAYLLIGVDSITLDTFSWRYAMPGTFFSVGVALVIITIFTSRSWLLEWKKSAIEAQELKTEVIANRYRALVEQLNPHFLFNSLNTLSGIVYEDADKSAHFIRKLSQIYRYLLDVQQEQLVELKSEVKFAEDYLSLQKIRFENSLEYQIDVRNQDDSFLPPLSLQLLLENAIKHNITSSEKPLLITITSEGKKLIVENNYQPKAIPDEASVGVGLKNIKNRYKYLSNREPVIRKTESSFSVELPLLSVEP